MLRCVITQLTAPHPHNYPNLRREALEHLELSPATLSSLFSDITDSWNHWVRETGAQPNPTHHLESRKPQSSPLGCCPSVLSSEMVGWRSPDTMLATLWTRIFFLLSNTILPFLNRSLLNLLLFSDHQPSVHFLLINSRFVALRPVINSPPDSIPSRPNSAHPSHSTSRDLPAGHKEHQQL